jgi:tetratricopeptide (TPR) repeat protein
MILITVLGWLLAAIALGQLALVARAFLIEKRQGLRRSPLRLAGSAGIAVLVVGLAIFTTLQKPAAAKPAATPPPPVAAKPENEPAIAAKKQEIADVEAKLKTLQDELAVLQGGPTITPMPADAAAESVPVWPAIVGLALVLLGFIVVALGDLSSLLPKKKATGDVTPEDNRLDGLITAAELGRWKDGLAHAAKVKLERLHKLEILDFLYAKAFCAIQAIVAPEGDAPSHQERTELLTTATGDLDRLLELAPHMAEARWLRGYVAATAGEWEPALTAFRAARAELPADLPHDHDESVCLLMLAEAKLAAADSEGATKLFDEVSGKGVLAGKIPVAVITHRILAVREHLKAGRFDDAHSALAPIRQVQGLDADGQRARDLACDVYEVVIRFRAGEHQRTLDGTTTFLAQWVPAGVPAVDEQAADEYLYPAVDPKKLPFPAELYRGVFFLQAISRVEVEGRRGRTLDDDAVQAIATSLLRGLQFEPRHRESLAALGALYLAFRKDRTEKAIAWLEAAVAMGVRSERARALVAEARRAELERQELLQMFRSAAARFLTDPTVARHVRAALVEDLGRFEDFRPVLVDLQAAGALDADATASPTMQSLRDRARFLHGIATDVTRRRDPADVQALTATHQEYARLVASLDGSAGRLEALEKTVMEQLGRIVLR